MVLTTQSKVTDLIEHLLDLAASKKGERHEKGEYTKITSTLIFYRELTIAVLLEKDPTTIKGMGKNRLGPVKIKLLNEVLLQEVGMSRDKGDTDTQES